MTATIEQQARELANADYEQRIAEIRASHNTVRPISFSGPFSGLDYKISGKEWDATSSDHFLKAVWRERARAMQPPTIPDA